MKPLRYIIPLAACAGALAIGGAGLSGCLDSQAYAQVGSQDPNAVSFKLENELGKSVTSIEVKANSAKEYDGALAQSAPIGNGETVEFSCVPDSDESDLRIKTDDGSRYVLHAVNLGDMEDATLKVAGQTAYLDYTSTKLGTGQNTLAGEKDLVITKLKASEAKQKAEVKRLAKAKEKAEAEKRAEAKKRAKAERELEKSKESEKETDAGGSKDKASKSSGASSSSSVSSKAKSSSSSSASSRKSGGSSSSRGSSASGSSKSHSGAKKSKGSSGSSKSSGKSKSAASAAQKAAQANGSTSEQQCTKDF